MGIVNADVKEIEIIPVAKGVIARWWLIAIAAILGVVVMWSQESDLSTTPSTIEVVRTYESRDETALLTLVGIDPTVVTPFPSFENQVLQVQEQAMRSAVETKIGFRVAVSVSRSDQRFSLINSNQGDGVTKFTFLSVGTPTYTFSCSDKSQAHCDTALDEYLFQLQKIRKESVISGLNRIQTLLESLPVHTESNTEKIEAIKAAKPLIKGELALLSTTSTSVGATVSTVKTSTYAFGLLGGALIGLLIALQLTLIDKRVRSLNQMSKRFESSSLLGLVTEDPSTIQHVAAAIVARARILSISSVSLIPVDQQTDAQNLAERISTVTSTMGITVASLSTTAKVSANDLISSNSGMIPVASCRVSIMDDVIETWSVLEKAQKPMVGVILVDAAI